jgi:uncharacterized protein involved in exopolysaccharide biosynthesis
MARRRIIRPHDSTPPPNPNHQCSTGKFQARLAKQLAALARWQKKLRRAFNAVARLQKTLARLERKMTTMENS